MLKLATERPVRTGIEGFDEVLGGGLPRGRVTVVLGGPGSGKTIFALQTLVAGARDDGEPGILVAFEESAQQIRDNARGFGWGRSLQRSGGKVEIFDAQLGESVIHGGDFDLLGLLAVVGARAKALKARRIVLDGVDVLLAQLSDASLARREVFRLRNWLGAGGFTGIITAKAAGNGDCPAHDYEFLQFLGDCVVTLQHRMAEGTALRSLRVAKRRGCAHSANDFPFTIGPEGIRIAATSESELHHPVSAQRLSSGVERLDVMLGGGYYRGSSTLITGAPGTSKTTLAASFAEACCLRRERTLFVSFDEAPEQIVRNVGSVGISLVPFVESGTLRMCSLRSRTASAEAHALRVRSMLTEHKARHLVIDPISALAQAGGEAVAEVAALRVLDFAKVHGITVLTTSLLGNNVPLAEETPIGISTIADTWLHLTYVSQAGERNRALTIIKSRGTAHSNQVREMLVARSGVTLADAYLAGGEVLMGTLRWEKESEERREHEAAQRSALERQKEAELALAEANARMEAMFQERAIREATLARLKAERAQYVSGQVRVERELQRRRGADKRVEGPRRTRSSRRAP